MGNNQLTRDYEFDEKPMGTGGPGDIWRIHAGISRQTRQEVSIFICSIATIEQIFGKVNVAKVIQRIRNESHILTKLKHPFILRVIQPLIESSKDLAIVTEPVMGSLNNILYHDYDGLPGGIANVPAAYKTYQLHNMELKYGMSQILEALAFCHQEAKLLHLNLCPSNIFLTSATAPIQQQQQQQQPQQQPSSPASSITPSAAGTWKLAGFHFSYFKPTASNTASMPQENELIYFGKSLKSTKGLFVPQLAFAAPEYVIQQQPDTCSDMFSFGCLMYSLLASNKKSMALTCAESVDEYKKHIPYLQSNAFVNYTSDEQVKHCLQRLLHPQGDQRPTAHEILTSDYSLHLFGEEVRALRYLHVLKLQDVLKKVEFLKVLENLLTRNAVFPERVLYQFVLPPLLYEMRDIKTVAFALPTVLFIADKMSPKMFGQIILPSLAKIFMLQQPTRIPLLLLQHFDMLLKQTSPAQHKDFVIPFLMRCLEMPPDSVINNTSSNSSAAQKQAVIVQQQVEEIQMEALKRAEQCFSANLITYADYKQQVLPRIVTLAQKAPTNSMVRVNALVSLGKSSPQLDKDVILEKLCPLLQHCLTVDGSAACIMTVVGVYGKIAKLPNLLSATDVAKRILPNMMPLMVEKSLNYDQYGKLMKQVRAVIAVVDQERLQQYEEAKQLEQATSEQAPLKQSTTLPAIPFAPPQQQQQQQPQQDEEEWGMSSWNTGKKEAPTTTMPQQPSAPVQQPSAPIVAKPVVPQFDDLLSKFDDSKRTIVPQQPATAVQQQPTAIVQPSKPTTTTPALDFDSMLNRFNDMPSPQQQVPPTITPSYPLQQQQQQQPTFTPPVLQPQRPAAPSIDSLLDRFANDNTPTIAQPKQQQLQQFAPTAPVLPSAPPQITPQFAPTTIYPQQQQPFSAYPTPTAVQQQQQQQPKQNAGHFDNLLDRFMVDDTPKKAAVPPPPTTTTTYSQPATTLPQQAPAFANQPAVDPYFSTWNAPATAAYPTVPTNTMSNPFDDDMMAPKKPVVQQQQQQALDPFEATLQRIQNSKLSKQMHQDDPFWN